ncbi:hypothetical protein pdam_00023371, partial [Pocillopora damicornis]
MSVWIESLSRSQFEVCLRESRTFDGPHRNLVVNWMAYVNHPSSWGAEESSEVVFSEYETPNARNSHALCEEVTKSYFRVCIKDDAGYGGQRENINVNYLVIGAFFNNSVKCLLSADLEPCGNVSCEYHSHCVALGPQQVICRCESSCPSFEEQVCASNGRTFRNLCLLEKEICTTRGNYSYIHPGSCKGIRSFPLQKGRHKFRNVPSWAEDQCESITFDPFIFYPHKKIYVQLTVNHFNYSDPAIVHEATAPWVESVNTTQFTACVTRAGRNDYPSDSFADVDWVAYQGAPSGGVAGEEKFSRWWTGTSCQTITLPSGKFLASPTVIVTAEHYRSGLKHDATSVWLEDVSASSFKICLREFQNFAGVHDDISVNWLAFDSLQRPLFREHNDVSFQNNASPVKNHNFAFCKDVSFIGNYSKSPTVLLTAKHSTSGGNAAAECNGIVSWIEYISTSGFRICVKEVFVNRFDPLTVSYAVLAGGATYVRKDGPTIRGTATDEFLPVIPGYKWNDVNCTDCHKFTCKK